MNQLLDGRVLDLERIEQRQLAESARSDDPDPGSVDG